MMAHHDTTILQHDHVILFVPRKRMVREIEKLLQGERRLRRLMR